MRYETGPRRRPFRRGMTLVELLIAATMTAVVAAASATLVSAVSNAAVETTDVRSTRAAGYYALGRTTTMLREARGIGEVTPTAMSLWMEDLNDDDQLNLYEAVVIRYDGSTKQIIYEYLEQPDGNPMPLTQLALADFKSVGNVIGLLTSPDKKSVVWADGVESLTFSAYPDYTDTRIVGVDFTIGSGAEAVNFSGAASPRASGDYLFETSAQGPPLPGSNRLRRTVTSFYNGLTEHLQVLGLPLGP